MFEKKEKRVKEKEETPIVARSRIFINGFEGKNGNIF